MTNNLFKTPEYVYIDSVYHSHANQESSKEVEEVLADFIKYRDQVLPYLNREKIKDLSLLDLEALFDSTILLASGRESNFVDKYYKTLFVQLAFQLGFLIRRLLPNSSYAKYAKSKMEWLSTMDVRLETKLLQSFFNKNVRVIDSPPPVADTTVSGEVVFWDLAEINYILTHLTVLGSKFNQFIN